MKPHIVMVIPRGEAVRNFLYSDTLRVLSENARVTLLSVVHDDTFASRFGSLTDGIIPLQTYGEVQIVRYVRTVLHNAHFRWLWSGVARNRFETHDAEAITIGQQALRKAWKAFIWSLANQTSLETLASIEHKLTLALRPTQFFDHLFDELRPDLVFNTSHVHGPASDLPMRVAHSKGIRTTGFVFSWDNLTSRSRIMAPYDYYLVWTEQIKADLLRIYRKVKAEQVFVTGTPQFDFHFKQENWLSREELAQYVGFDPSRPFILYTTGIDKHFPEEHRTVELVIHLLDQLPGKPQLVVRSYVKGTSEAMRNLMCTGYADVFFPPMQWDDKWFMPTEADQRVYTSMLRECALGINAASTVTLELMLHRKPIINLGFDPPGSNLPHHLRYTRHTDEFDHFMPVKDSGAVMVARSEQDMVDMLRRGLVGIDVDRHTRFLDDMFGDNLDGCAGDRIGCLLTHLAKDAWA